MQILLVLLLFLSGTALAGPRIVATVPDLGAIASEVGGDRVDVTVLARPTEDPHFVDPRPSFALALSKADLVVVNGLGLETGWLPTLLVGSRNARIQPGARGYLDASTLITPKQRPSGPIDRAMGDVHPHGNPHYTLDPRNAPRIAHAVAERLATIDPDGAQEYRDRAEAFERSVEAHVQRWEAHAAPLRGQPVVQYHRSFVYLTDWLGLEVVAEIEPKPGIPPTPRHVLAVVRDANERNVQRVLVEAWHPATAARRVAEQTGARLVIVPGQTPKGSSYLKHIGTIIDLLVSDGS